MMHVGVAARRAALLKHASICAQEAVATRDEQEKVALLRDARDMRVLALALETDRAAA